MYVLKTLNYVQLNFIRFNEKCLVICFFFKLLILRYFEICNLLDSDQKYNISRSVKYQRCKDMEQTA